jgi:hypothetical protein
VCRTVTDFAVVRNELHSKEIAPSATNNGEILTHVTGVQAHVTGFQSHVIEKLNANSQSIPNSCNTFQALAIQLQTHAGDFQTHDFIPSEA